MQLFLAAAIGAAAAQETPGGRIHNLKVLSDRIDDVTTPENILRSFVRPGMSDAERAEALFRAVVKYRHQASPPDEKLAADWEAHDPVKLLNVYGYCMCCCHSSLIAALNRLDGREARGRILEGHSVAEVFYGGGWHMYDPSLINYFPKPDGTIASVDEIAAAVGAWYEKNPEYRGNEPKLRALHASDGWTGWKRGPELLARSPFYDATGWWPARTHGWYATMIEYGNAQGVYEYGYQVGHRALVSLRPGESFTREAGHRGLHVNGDPGWEGLKARAPDDDLVYVPKYLPGYTGGLVGNGVHRYAPDLSGLEQAAEAFENLAFGGGALRPKAAGKPGIAVIEMRSPYVYLGGRVRIKAAGGGVELSVSTNNGRTFTPVGKAGATVELGERILRRYAYWLRLEVGAGSSVESLVIENDFQHAPRSMAWLGRGKNTITVAADGDPGIGVRTVACRITPDAAFSANETSASMGVTFENLEVVDGACWWKGGVGALTVPIEAPGPIVALRFSAQIRARGEKDLIKMLASTDGGKSWAEAGRIAGPTPGTTRSFAFKPADTAARRALMRFELTGNNTVGIFNFRLDADYEDPRASPLRSLVVVHRWSEGGREKVLERRIEALPATYTIEAAEEPVMGSVTIRY
jgi:hypothetical protein